MSEPRPDAANRAKRGAMREVAAGARMAWQGLRTWGTSPRLMAWGLVPGVVTAVLFGVAGVVLATQLVSWSGSIADALVSSDGALNNLIHVVAALAIVGGAVLIAVYTFTAVTLTVGQPFFERISRAVDDRYGFQGADHEEPWYRASVRGLGELAHLSLLTVPLALGLFLIGLLPVVGGIAAFVLGATCGGWFLALELTSYPLSRRGVYTLAQRRAVLRERRPVVVGFGATVFVLFLIPAGAALLMPAVVAGATRLVQDVSPGLDTPHTSGGGA